MDRARDARQDMAADSSLEAYRALATGHVYFLFDRRTGGASGAGGGSAGEGERSGELGRSLIKADQVAVEVYWQEPGLSRQIIVGRRDERHLPTTIRYHVDHLTVVTDDFDDRITLGQGDEVRAAIHPLAPGSETAYDFRLGDSLSLSYPGLDEPIRVQEIQVRPKEPSRPGVVGSVFVDRRTAGVVRMGLTFTPASYVDPNLDHIRITLDNRLWEERHWLPYRQETEIRREFPFLATPSGTVILARFQIGDYTFNERLAPRFFSGPDIEVRPEAELEAYPFEEGLHAGLEAEGLSPAPDVEAVRRRALQLLAEERLSGLPALRPWLPSASRMVRHNRAEGLYLGGGARFDPAESLGVELAAGFAFGRERASATVGIDGGSLLPGSGIEGAWNELRDTGTLPGASGAMSSLSSLLRSRDYVDPYFIKGVRFYHGLTREGVPGLRISARLEDHRGGRSVDDDASGRRPLPAVEAGTLAAVDADFETDPFSVGAASAGGLSIGSGVTVGQFEGRSFEEGRLRIRWARIWLDAGLETTVELRGAALSGDPPPQLLYSLGGRGTLPGYDYRTFAGDRFWLIQARGSWKAAGPWVRPKIFVSTGATHDAGSASLATLGRASGSPRVSMGIGAGFLWNILQLDAGYGIETGEWEWILSVDRSLWSFL